MTADHDALFAAHIRMVERLNKSRTLREYELNGSQLAGFRAALETIGVSQLLLCDAYYLERGVTRLMCAGVFLNWEPTTES